MSTSAPSNDSPAVTRAKSNGTKSYARAVKPGKNGTTISAATLARAMAKLSFKEARKYWHAHEATLEHYVQRKAAIRERRARRCREHEPPSSPTPT